MRRRRTAARKPRMPARWARLARAAPPQGAVVAPPRLPTSTGSTTSIQRNASIAARAIEGDDGAAEGGLRSTRRCRAASYARRADCRFGSARGPAQGRRKAGAHRPSSRRRNARNAGTRPPDARRGRAGRRLGSAAAPTAGGAARGHASRRGRAHRQRTAARVVRRQPVHRPRHLDGEPSLRQPPCVSATPSSR